MSCSVKKVTLTFKFPNANFVEYSFNSNLLFVSTCSFACRISPSDEDCFTRICEFVYDSVRIRKTLKFTRTRREAEQAEAVIMNQVFQRAYGLEPRQDQLF
jgi:hypothetical protein